MGKGSHDPQADEPAKLAARTLTMKRSASRDLLGDALDCAASCIDAAALDAYRLDYASSALGVVPGGAGSVMRGVMPCDHPQRASPRSTSSERGGRTH